MRNAIHEGRNQNVFERVSSEQQKAVVTNLRDATSTAVSTLESLCLIRSTPGIANALSQFRVRLSALDEALMGLATAQEAEQDLETQASSLNQCSNDAYVEACQLRAEFLDEASSERHDYRRARILVSEASVKTQFHSGDGRTQEQLNFDRQAYELLRVRLTQLENEIVAAQAPPLVTEALALARGLADQCNNATRAKPTARANTVAAARKVGDYVAGLQKLLQAVHPVIAEEISSINQLTALAGNAFSQSLTATAKLEAATTQLAAQVTKGLDYED